MSKAHLARSSRATRNSKHILLRAGVILRGLNELALDTSSLRLERQPGRVFGRERGATPRASNYGILVRLDKNTDKKAKKMLTKINEVLKIQLPEVVESVVAAVGGYDFLGYRFRRLLSGGVDEESAEDADVKRVAVRVDRGVFRGQNVDNVGAFRVFTEVLDECIVWTRERRHDRGVVVAATESLQRSLVSSGPLRFRLRFRLRGSGSTATCAQRHDSLQRPSISESVLCRSGRSEN